MLTNIYLFLNSFFIKLGKDRIVNYSASSAFFIILSIFPFLILLTTIVQYTPLTKDFLIERLEFLFPSPVFPLIEQIVNEIFSSTAGAAIISVSAIGGIWSASKGVMSLIRGINTCFNTEDRRTWLHVRLLSCLYTLISIIFIIFFMVLLVFGSSLYNSLQEQLGETGKFLGVILFILRRRFIIGLVGLTLIFTLIYKFFPSRHNNFAKMLPGAVLAALAWVGLSGIISVYVNHFPNFTYTYGSLTSFIVLMLYLYFGIYIVFLGAEVNFFFKSEIDKSYAARQRKKVDRYEALEKKRQKKQKNNTQNDKF